MKSLVSLLIIILIFTTSIICFSSCAKDGTDGKDGADGKTPTIEISEDGYWVINGEKTDVKAEGKDGEPGKDGVGSSANENPQGLDFYLKDDGTYAVAIGNAKYLSHIEIPESYCDKAVTEIAYDGFEGAQKLKSISIPNSITSIGDSAFSNCSSLTSITIPDSVTSIGDSVLYGCSSLTSITLPFLDRTIVEFYGINLDDFLNIFSIENSLPLKTIVVTDGTEIPDYAFVGCTSLTSFTIPDDVTSVGKYAFAYCISLTSVVIGNGVTSIGELAFGECVCLVEIINKSSLPITAGSDEYGEVGYFALEVHDGESKIVNQDDFLFYTTNDVNYLISYVGDNTEIALPTSYDGKDYVIKEYAFAYSSDLYSVVIPDSVTSISDWAFSGCTSLISIVIPSSVTSIGNRAFDDCTSLISVVIPDSVTSIGSSVFDSCTSLTSVVIGNGVTSIGYSAFDGCTSLASIVIPDSVTSIGDFAFDGCDSLTDVYYTGTLEEWAKISIGYGNYYLDNATIHYNYIPEN